jgi:hypothetical protein
LLANNSDIFAMLLAIRRAAGQSLAARLVFSLFSAGFAVSAKNLSLSEP